ncbi:hypothetical protein B0T20DRAFT_250906 [Sordaria brevicollis]|uniref:C2H2-type domain-containing protein n=1 Tax=Sordaria brevicollis TaxID=83679 RepID=A0AAE0PC68_SORBR|nr:hypothetical protein B0T20DRAFT_250906 [Sordaria brevicollis]
MALTPPALTRSPSTPSHSYCPSERSSVDYPSPGLVEQQYKISSIYGDQSCSVTSSMDPGSSLPPLESMGQPDWNSTVILPASSATGMPSILAAEYGSYGGYNPYGQDVYHSHHDGHALSTSTPPPSGPSSRSPIPSMSRTSLSYQSNTSMASQLTPRVKMEEYGSNMEVSHYPSPRSMNTSYPSDSGAYTHNTTGYLSDGGSSGWGKSEYQPLEPEFYPGPGAAQASTFLTNGQRAYRVPRPKRQQRRLTTKEEANFQCEVKGCGKLFSRSYNYKAHLETHEPNRDYPFPCQEAGCTKKFVRKTDLQRHHQSVHLKERSHKCDYCGRLFARKDTLRRHMEDGCSKRFDITTMDLRPETYDSFAPRPSSSGPAMTQHHYSGLSSSTNTGIGGLPPMAIPSLGSSGILSSLPPSMRADAGQGHSWGR